MQHLGAGVQQRGAGAQQEGLQHLGAGAQQEGLQQTGAGAQHLGAGAQQHRFFFLNRPRHLLKNPPKQLFFLQQGCGQQTGAGAQQRGATGLQQTGAGAQHLGLQQTGAGAQQEGLQHLGAGAQQEGAVLQHPLLCFSHPKPASALLALTQQTTRAAVKVIHFIFISPRQLFRFS